MKFQRGIEFYHPVNRSYYSPDFSTKTTNTSLFSASKSVRKPYPITFVYLEPNGKSRLVESYAWPDIRGSTTENSNNPEYFYVSGKRVSLEGLELLEQEAAIFEILSKARRTNNSLRNMAHEQYGLTDSEARSAVLRLSDRGVIHNLGDRLSVYQKDAKNAIQINDNKNRSTQSPDFFLRRKPKKKKELTI